MEFRKAVMSDIDDIEVIYGKIHDEEEAGNLTTGWIRGVYPTRDTALAALERDDLFVGIDDGKIFGSCVINQIQVDVYADAEWEHDAPPEEVMVMHALAISPDVFGSGYGKAFVRYYENYALDNGCPYLRMDTNFTNPQARGLYKSLGFKEVGVIQTEFNGLSDVYLVCLEKLAERS